MFIQRLRRHTAWRAPSFFDYNKGETASLWFILLPDGPLTKVYNVITASAVIYVGFSIFLTIGFANYLPPYNLHVFEKVVDAWFWLDIALNFVTAFYHNGKLVTHPGEIIGHYFQSWFLIDFLGNLPFESMTAVGQRGERKFIKILKFLKIPRLLRLARLRRILQGKGKYLNLVMYLALAILGIHAAGCLWMLALGPCAEFPPKCSQDGSACDWHYLEDIDPHMVVQDPLLGPECVPATMGSLYAMALSYGTSMVLGAGGIEIDTVDGGHYRSRELSIGSMTASVANFSAPTTLTSYDLINVSPFPPNSFGASFYTNIWVLSVVIRILGFIGVAFLTAVILKLEINAGHRETIFRRHVEALEAELASAGGAIPDPLMKRIRDHIAERWHSGDFGKSELQTTNLFSAQLKGEIIASLNKDILMKIPFFRVATFEAVQLICQSIGERKFLPGELIFRRGEVSAGLYLVRSGTVILSPYSTSWSNVRRTVQVGDRRILKEPQDDGTRPLRTSFLRMRRNARNFQRSFTKSFSRKSRQAQSEEEYSISATFPVTTGSWFGESEVLRELVLHEKSEVYRRSTTAEAKTVVSLLVIPTEALAKVLFDYPLILQELLIAHLKRFNSADLPPALRSAFRFSDEWEERVNKLISEISRSRKGENEFDSVPMADFKINRSRSVIRQMSGDDS